MTLRAYDRWPSQLQGMYQDSPISLAGKQTLIHIKVVDAQPDYDILLGQSFMYSMKDVTLSLFQVMMFPHNLKVVTIDQLTYNEPGAKGPPNNIISEL